MYFIITFIELLIMLIIFKPKQSKQNRGIFDLLSSNFFRYLNNILK